MSESYIEKVRCEIAKLNEDFANHLATRLNSRINASELPDKVSGNLFYYRLKGAFEAPMMNGGTLATLLQPSPIQLSAAVRRLLKPYASVFDLDRTTIEKTETATGQVWAKITQVEDSHKASFEVTFVLQVKQ